MSTKFDGPGNINNQSDRRRMAACVLDGRNPKNLRASDIQVFFVMDNFDDDIFVIENGVIMVSQAIFDKFTEYRNKRVMSN